MRKTQKNISQSTFSKILGVSRQRVSQMVDAGLPTEPDGQIDRTAGLAWVKRNVLKKKDAGPSLIVVRVETELLKQELLRIELAEKQGEVVSVEASGEAWGGMIMACRSRLLAIPSKLGPVVASESDPNLCQEAIRVEIYAALTELSSYDPGELGTPKKGRKQS
jgi:phage terminase Nu1 subunit (DNA packaging protein)